MTTSEFKSSCIEVRGTSETSWLYLNIESSTFTDNLGHLTNEVYFDNSLASLRIGSYNGVRSVFTIEDQVTQPLQIAKVLYKPATSDALV